MKMPTEMHKEDSLTHSSKLYRDLNVGPEMIAATRKEMTSKMNSAKPYAKKNDAFHYFKCIGVTCGTQTGMSRAFSLQQQSLRLQKS